MAGKIDRRTFLKRVLATLVGVASGSALPVSTSEAQEEKEFFGILVDVTKCIGCRRCEKACAEVNNLPIPDISEKTNEAIFKEKRKLTETQYTVINLYETEKGKFFVPKRCMHCNQPACAAACLVRAMKKREVGHVTWETNCMGCRFCMISCPFDVPKFEYDKAIPKIKKCDLCWGRFLKGLVPACVEACLTGALMFGKRRDLLKEAKRRIAYNPAKYYPHIYGEYEVGGTSVLYLSAVSPEQIGFRIDLGVEPYPKYSLVYLSAIPFIATLTPLFMLGISHAVRKWKKKA